jgi:hypothetical protein
MCFFIKKREREKVQKGQVPTRATDTHHIKDKANQHTSHQGQG